ncbi:MAG TPA: sigma-70 family RNA polymerase sigma factor [Solirubrobacteraceae bacterium]
MAQLADTPGMEAVVLRPRFGRRRSPGGRSEGELLARIRGGDDTAFEELYDAYQRRLLTFCHHMLGSREEAEDVLQHTFMAAYRSLRAGYEVVELKPWLYTIARNRCLSVMRARHEEVELDDRAPAIEGLAAEVDRRAELRMLVRDVQRLPPDQRAALVLFEVGDHSHKEIAAVLGVRHEKVKALVFQAREALMGWRTARETPCAHVREQLATLRGRALGRATIRRHVELCSGCADYEAAVRYQRAALAVALPVAPAAAGLRAAVLGSAAGGSGFGAAVGAGGVTSAAGGFAGLGVNGVAAKVLLVTALVGGAGAARHATVDQPPRNRAVLSAPGPRATPPPSAARLTAMSAAVTDAATARRAAGEPPRLARTAAAKGAAHGRRATRGHDAQAAMATGKATAPGQLKAPGAPATGKALGHAETKASGAKRTHRRSGAKGSAPTTAKAQAVSGGSSTPAQAPRPATASRAPKAAAPPAPRVPAQSSEAPAAPGQADALPPRQANKQAETPKQP